MRWNREEYIGYLLAKDAPRAMFGETLGLLVGLDREWKAQGASAEELNLTAFELDYVPVHAIGETGFTGGTDPVVLEETEEYRIERDRMGRTMKLCKGAATIPLPLDFPVKDMDSWRAIKPRFEFNAERVTEQALDAAAAAQASGSLILTRMPGGFDFARQLMGEENACLCYYEDPELMVDMLSTVRDTMLRVLEVIHTQLSVDNLSIHEDFAGKSGPLVGPNQIREFITPYFKPVIEQAREHGTRIISLDSDGDIRPVIPALLESGVNLLMPMEPAAGMDIVELRKEYGAPLLMKGGIDKHVLRRSKEEIRKELEYKMQPFMRTGGIVFGLDHRIPNGTPIENYRYYIDTAREILGLPPRTRPEPEWKPLLF